MKVAVISHFHEGLRGLMAAAARLNRACPGWGALRVFDATSPVGEAEAGSIRGVLECADALVVDLPRAHPSWQALAGSVLPGARGFVVGHDPVTLAHVRVGSSQPAENLRRSAEVMEAYRRMAPGDADYVLVLLVGAYGGNADVEVRKPAVRPEGMYLADPVRGVRFDSRAEFEADAASRNAAPGPDIAREPEDVIVVLFNGYSFPTNPEPVAGEVVEALRPYARVVPVAVETDPAHSIEPLRGLLTREGYRPDLIVNTMAFRLGAGPMGGDVDAGEGLLRELDAPLVHTIQLSQYSVDEWHSSHSLSPSEVLVSVMLPEFDGTVCQIPVAAKVMVPPPEGAPQGAIATADMAVIPEQMARLVGRVRTLLRLRRLANQDKRVALIGYDYPAGEGALLAAAQLDVARSIEAILGRLAAEGYRTHKVAAEQIRADLLAKGVNDPAYGTAKDPTLYPREQMWADLANERARAEVAAHWRGREELPMVDAGGDFLIPGVEYGNVFVGVQPGRARVEDSHTAHDDTTPPHPQYLAYYTWLREVWKADVVVHVGTHSTFEFLKSRENAVSVRDFPDLMLADLPHVYLYYISNPAEGLAVRRRAHGVLVSYQPTLMVGGCVPEQIARIDSLLDAYRRGADMTPQNLEDLAEDIRELASQAHLPTDPLELEAEVERMKARLVPMGLHVFGAVFDAEQIRLMTRALLAAGHDDVAPAFERMARLDGLTTAEVDRLGDREIRVYEQRAMELVDRALAGAELAESEVGRGIVQEARAVARAWRTNDEWSGLLRALSGRHIAARLGGDPIRTPDVLPSGSSLYQFDPRQVPSPLARRRGEQMAQQLKEAYAREHEGQAPRVASIVLWGLETTRTHGETYAQIMSLIGVRPVAHARPGRRRWEVIPTEELEGPRCDVVVTISGFFRDLFPILIDELDDMFAAVSALDEPAEVNPIAARTRATHEQMVAAGFSTNEAEELAHVRLFGPKPGLYSGGLTGVVEDGAWETRQDLADSFVAGLEHVYSKGRHGERVGELYGSHLAHVDVVSQLRSNNEYSIVDLDHYFEFLDGMSAAVTSSRGQAVTTVVADTTGRRVQTTSASDAARAGLYAQLLNPAWQEAMLDHGHQGVGEVYARTTNLLGLAATTAQMGSWMFDAVFDTYIGDAEILARLRELNPHASASIAARLVEAARRDLWQATEEQLDALDAAQFEIDTQLEGATGEGGDSWEH